jgi:hypothetical protein
MEKDKTSVEADYREYIEGWDEPDSSQILNDVVSKLNFWREFSRWAEEKLSKIEIVKRHFPGKEFDSCLSTTEDLEYGGKYHYIYHRFRNCASNFDSFLSRTPTYAGIVYNTLLANYPFNDKIPKWSFVVEYLKTIHIWNFYCGLTFVNVWGQCTEEEKLKVAFKIQTEIKNLESEKYDSYY